MKNRLELLILGSLLLGAIACSATSAVSTATPATLAFPTNTPPPPLPTATETPTFVGTEVSAAGTSFILSEGLGTGATNQLVPANSDTSNPVWDIHPAYTQFNLQGYPLEGKFFEPQIFVYPTTQFAQMQEGAAAIIVNLEALLAHPNNALPSQLPFLPPFNAAQVFTAQPKILHFQNGSGIRYLTEFAQYPASANNHDLFYTFQGLTNDGANYVTAILPINASFLAADEKPESAVPPDGIPYDQNNPQGYYAAILAKLNSTEAGAFSPSLDDLDTLIQSITAGSPH